MWSTRRKQELQNRIAEAEASIEEAHKVQEEVVKQQGMWDLVVARRSADGLGAELEISFTRRDK